MKETNVVNEKDNCCRLIVDKKKEKRENIIMGVLGTISIIAILASINIPVVNGNEMSKLESAIWAVETSCCPGDCPSGDGGNAIGPLQIWEVAWLDVAKEGESYSDCENLEYSIEVFRRYTKRYATEKRIGRPPTAEDKARIWNGGPNGFKKKKKTDKYWNKVKEILNNNKEKLND